MLKKYSFYTVCFYERNVITEMPNDILLQITYVTGGCLLRRCHDVDAHVRRDAVVAVINILKSPAIDASSMSALVDCVKERLRDVKVI